MAEVPHFLLPLTLTASGDFAVVEQDSEQEVAQHARAVLNTPLGHRELEPGLGRLDTTHLLMRDGVSPTQQNIEQQLERYEPRAEFHAAAHNLTPGEWVDRVDVNLLGVKP